MDTPSYDVIVIGAGPAGLTAATDAARAGLKALCLDKLAPGGALINLGELHDFEEIWNGPDMAARMTDDATVAGVEIGFGEVTGLSGSDSWTVETAEGEKHTAHTVVIATGLNKGKLGLPNEADYEGRGISHCAHCDGPLYAGLPVVVAGAVRRRRRAGRSTALSVGRHRRRSAGRPGRDRGLEEELRRTLHAYLQSQLWPRLCRRSGRGAEAGQLGDRRHRPRLEFEAERARAAVGHSR